MTGEIKHVTQERLRELFKLTDKGLITKVTRINAPIGKGSYLHKSTGYKILKVDGRQYREHRLVWIYVHGTLPKILDHIDGNKENNNINNLRRSTASQNAHNAKLNSNNTSGVKGVSWYKKHQKWRGQVKNNNKQVHVGYFEELKDAEAATCKLREKLHGKFTNHGIIS
jgi:hypothetical protein|tara:strand:- start:207 stop:713 length:507 start_codon:yes stop_codon:yes gene_type:complete